MKSGDLKLRTVLYAHVPDKYTHGAPVVVIDTRVWRYDRARDGRPANFSPAPGQRAGRIAAGWANIETGVVGIPVVVLDGRGPKDPQALLDLDLPVLEYTEQSMKELREALPEGFGLRIALPVKIVSEWTPYVDLAAAKEAAKQAKREAERRSGVRFRELQGRLEALGITCGQDGARSAVPYERATVAVEELHRLLDMLPKEAGQ